MLEAMVADFGGGALAHPVNMEKSPAGTPLLDDPMNSGLSLDISKLGKLQRLGPVPIFYVNAAAASILQNESDSMIVTGDSPLYKVLDAMGGKLDFLQWQDGSTDPTIPVTQGGRGAGVFAADAASVLRLADWTQREDGSVMSELLFVGSANAVERYNAYQQDIGDLSYMTADEKRLFADHLIYAAAGDVVDMSLVQSHMMRFEEAHSNWGTKVGEFFTSAAFDKNNNFVVQAGSFVLSMPFTVGGAVFAGPGKLVDGGGSTEARTFAAMDVMSAVSGAAALRGTMKSALKSALKNMEGRFRVSDKVDVPDTSASTSAAKISSQWQGEYPYWGVDELVDTGLAKGDKIVQLTYRKDGVPTSSYFTTVESLQKAQVGGGAIDANILNQGLQTFPGGRSDFKLYAQVFQVGEDIPTFGAARGSTTANPYFNPSQVDTLEQIFILDDFKSSLKPTNLIKLNNTKTPEYLPLDQVTNNMLRLDTQ